LAWKYAYAAFGVWLKLLAKNSIYLAEGDGLFNESNFASELVSKDVAVDSAEFKKGLDFSPNSSFNLEVFYSVGLTISSFSKVAVFAFVKLF